MGPDVLVSAVEPRGEPWNPKAGKDGAFATRPLSPEGGPGTPRHP